MFKTGDIVRKKVRGRTNARVVYVDNKYGELHIQTLKSRKKAEGGATIYVPAARERRVRAADYQLVS